MKLTEDDFDKLNHLRYDFSKDMKEFYIYKDILPKFMQLKQQILDDYEKARKWEDFKFQLEPDYITLKKLVHNMPNNFKMDANQKNSFFNMILQWQEQSQRYLEKWQQNQKLRELIEKRVKIEKTSVRDYEQEMLLKELLEESKK